MSFSFSLNDYYRSFSVLFLKPLKFLITKKHDALFNIKWYFFKCKCEWSINYKLVGLQNNACNASLSCANLFIDSVAEGQLSSYCLVLHLTYCTLYVSCICTPSWKCYDINRWFLSVRTAFFTSVLVRKNDSVSSVQTY